tara:strand:- start:194349 stop:195164 length:816 start_codon:yes stop_codon:yes gene_type:complete
MHINGETSERDNAQTDHENDSVNASMPEDNACPAPLLSPADLDRNLDREHDGRDETLEEAAEYIRPELKDSTEETDPAKIKAAEKRPARRCIVSKEIFETDKLLRFVLSPDNIVTPDLDEALPGRGAWVKADHASLQTAITNNLFSKSFKTKVIIADDLLLRVGALLNKKCLDLLNLARRSGACVLGFDKSYNAARKLPMALYITAAQPQSDSRRKMEHALSENAEIITFWNAEALSNNFGTANTNHAVVKPCGIAKKFIKQYRKLCAVVV